ncbi:MAG: ubiquinone/menaquinone biosynthesis methyltransferase [Osedax symbiont Rs1]|nr:MAG: ubiquinone/menaquinone biosynthesis methyltransferase [Osedax symbiont Rs1]
MSQADKNTTDFGFKEVPKDEKVKRVADVFHSVAAKYDVMNDLMSGGIHRIWKKLTIEQSGARNGMKILDIAGGTGDLTLRFARIVGSTGRVTLADINDSMLKVGRDKLTDKGAVANIDFVQANAECLPFPDNHFDIITIAFGLRNVTDKDAALRSMQRVLKPGGKLMILEFSKTNNPMLSSVYDFYSFNILPKLGELIAGDGDSYQYLAESIRMHPDQETLKSMMQDADFVQCKYRNMTGGVVALHTAIKP